MESTELITKNPINTEVELYPSSPRINLSTSEDVRREMARVYRETRSLAINTNEAAKLTYILTQILKAHELSCIEQRLFSLETQKNRSNR
jgi:hypothetical protein